MTHDLTEVFVRAVGPLVRERTGRLPVQIDLESEIDQAARWLRSELDRLLDLPFDQQARGPLELAQEAMRFPTAALASAGVVPIERDPVSTSALPGDLYGLAPISSRDLGEEAWTAHLAWGAAKAAALRSAAGGDG